MGSRRVGVGAGAAHSERTPVDWVNVVCLPIPTGAVGPASDPRWASAPSVGDAIRGSARGGRLSRASRLPTPVVAALGACSSAATSSIDCGRSSGRLASMRMTSCSTCGGTSKARLDRVGGGSAMWPQISSPWPSPTKGGRPQTISKGMQPSE